MKKTKKRAIKLILIFSISIAMIISVVVISAVNIEIIKANHLNSDKNFISNIYEEVKSLDNIWSEPINDNEYVRITFERELNNTRDIAIYPRIVNGNPRIEIYEKDETELIAEFTKINSNQYNKVYLTNLQENQDTFDLKIINGSVEFDYIIDPPTEIDFETFATDLGDWVTSYSGDEGCVWQQDTDGTGSSSTGPCSGSSNCGTDDAGYDDNEYAYVETSSSDCNTGTAHAYLDYQNIDMDTYGDVNFSFAWNMYGTNIGNLSFQIDDGVGGWITLWSLTGNQGTDWGFVSLDLSSYSGTRDIRIDYYRNGQTSYRGDIAIDVLNITDISIGGGDTCTYSSGDWNIDCTDNCILSSNVDGGGNTMTMTGIGRIFIDSTITNFDLYHVSGGCNVTCRNGCIKYD